MPEYGFSMSGVALSGGEDPIGTWTPREEQGVSFGVGDAQLPEEPTWYIRLPASPEQAEAILAAQAQAQTLGQRDLSKAQAEILRLTRTEAVSFSPTDPLLAQKTALRSRVEQLQEAEVSFGLFQRRDPDEAEAREQWESFVVQVERMVGNLARVRTDIEGASAGLTTVGWTGDFSTLWAPDTSSHTMRLHLQSVHLALASRIALMRIVSVVSTGAVGLALKTTVPGAQVMLLPAVWRFVRDVLKELRQSWPQLKNL